MFEEHLGLQKFDLVMPNIRIAEQQETQKVATQAQQNVATEVAGRAENIAMQAVEEQQAALQEI